MTSLATRNANAHGVPAVAQAGVSLASSSLMTLAEVWQMAEYVAEAKLFPVETPQQVFTLMMLAQSEGLHPIQALRRYHIIEGRPSMRADAMQAEFQARGGVVKILRNDDVEARAHVSHPTLQPQGHEFSFTYEQAARSGVNVGKYGEKINWKTHRADMLWSRMITKAVRKIYPGIVAGIYSDAEVEDMAVSAQPEVVHARSKAEAVEAVRKADVPVPGQPEGVDIRPYAAVSTDAALAVGYKPADLHKHLMLRALQTDHAEGPTPTRIGEAVKRLAAVYAEHRDWLREEVAAFCVARTFDREVETADSAEGERESAEVVDPEFDFEPGSEG